MLLGEGEAVTMLLKFNSKEARRGSEIFEPVMRLLICEEEGPMTRMSST